MWVPPSPLEDTTGYRISYTVVGGSSNSVNISDATTSNYTLSGLKKGKDYNISIVGTSDHFSSMSVAWDLITLEGQYKFKNKYCRKMMKKYIPK